LIDGAYVKLGKAKKSLLEGAFTTFTIFSLKVLPVAASDFF